MGTIIPNLLDYPGLDLADDCMTLADALVYDAPGEAGEAHWNEEARALISGIILSIVTSEPASTRNVATLRDRLTLAPQAFATQLADMQAQGGLAARAANRHLGKSDREAAGVLSAAQRHTHFLDRPRITAVLGHSDFTFADVKARATTVYLVLPPDRLATYARWLRLMLAQGLTELARARLRDKPRAVPARRVRSIGPSRTCRARHGPDGRLRHPALADLARHTLAPRAL